MSKSWVPGFQALPFAVLCYFCWNFSFTSPIICLQGRREATLWTCKLEGCITGTLQFLFHPGLQRVSKHLLCEYISSLWKLQLCRELHWSGASQGIAVPRNTKSCSPSRPASGSDWICKALKSFTAALSNTNICMFFVWNKRKSGKTFHLAHKAALKGCPPSALWGFSAWPQRLVLCEKGLSYGALPICLAESLGILQVILLRHPKPLFIRVRNTFPQPSPAALGTKAGPASLVWQRIPIAELGCHRNLQVDFCFSRAENFWKKIWFIAFSPLKREGVGFFSIYLCGKPLW